MQDTRTNRLVPGESLEALRGLVPKEDQGPTFEVNEIVPIKGYLYRLKEIRTQFGGALIFIPHGPTKKSREKAAKKLTSKEKADRQAERRDQRRDRGEKR